MIKSYLGFRRRLFYVLLSVVMASTIIITMPQPGYGQSWVNWILQGVQVIQLSTLSDAQEVRYGQQINQELINSGQANISRNKGLTQTVQRMGQRLAKNSSRPKLPFTFQVVDDDAVNAFATMGGFVYINTGLMATAENEAELASVIAHEIGHITQRHAITQMRDVAISQGLMSAAGLSENNIVQLGVQLGVNLPHSREAELEADQVGLKTLQRSGYAPIGMVTFMKKLMQQGGGTTSAFLSTHPATSERVKALSKSIDPKIANQGDGLNNQAYQQQIRRFL